MTAIAVIAHSGKTVGGGLGELRRELARFGVCDPIWYEVSKSRKAPKRVRAALDAGAELIFVWGGDGMVQRCIDAVAGYQTDVPIAIVPAGTANLLASNLDIPRDIARAVEAGMGCCERQIDLGIMNDEHFAVMAGAGLDALMIRDADGGLKDRLGRVAYVWTGAKHLSESRVKTRVRVDGDTWFKGKTGCVLIGNVGKVFGDISAFADASPDDGRLEIGVVTAKGPWQWGRTLARTMVADADGSPFVETARGRRFDIRFAEPVVYEIDGGARAKVTRLRVEVKPAAVRVRVPQPAPA